MRILIHRQGAYGDIIITTPLVKRLHELGHEVIYMTSERGQEVLKCNPYIKRLVFIPKDSVAIDKLGEKIAKVAKENQCDKVIDLSESIEVALSLHAMSPAYHLPKYERRLTQEKNFYEYTYEHAAKAFRHEETSNGRDIIVTDVKAFNWRSDSYIPHLYFEDKELKEAHAILRKPAFNLLVGMSGSGGNKVWPWTEALCNSIANEYGDKVHIITVGDLRASILENDPRPTITNLSGKLSMRVSMALTGIVDCVISPDTGLLHASGCYETPKIGLLGHNTIECITKHFINDFSIEADEEKAECAPCFRLIYDRHIQCPLDPNTGGSYCMSKGIEPETVFERFKEVYAQSKERG